MAGCLGVSGFRNGSRKGAASYRRSTAGDRAQAAGKSVSRRSRTPGNQGRLERTGGAPERAQVASGDDRSDAQQSDTSIGSFARAGTGEAPMTSSQLVATWPL